jgi:hypothetical protein
MGIEMKKLPLLKIASSDANKNKLSEMICLSNPVIATIVALALGSTINSAQAGERESLEQLRATTTNLVNLLVQEGVLSKDKADALLKQAAQDAEKAKEKVK